MAYADLIAAADRAAQSALGGEPVIYFTGEGDSAEVVGIFDSQFVLDKGTSEAGVETACPAVFLRLEDLPSVPEDDDPTLTIRGVDYRVIERKPDDMGGILLVLRTIT